MVLVYNLLLLKNMGWHNGVIFWSVVESLNQDVILFQLCFPSMVSHAFYICSLNTFSKHIVTVNRCISPLVSTRNNTADAEPVFVQVVIGVSVNHAFKRCCGRWRNDKHSSLDKMFEVTLFPVSAGKGHFGVCVNQQNKGRNLKRKFECVALAFPAWISAIYCHSLTKPVFLPQSVRS